MRILGVNNYQSQKDSRVNFGMKTISAERATEIGQALCKEVGKDLDGNPDIAAFMERYDELPKVLVKIFRLNKQKLKTDKQQLGFVTRILSNVADWAEELSEQCSNKFPLSREALDDSAIEYIRKSNIMDHICSALSQVFKIKDK